MECGGGGGADVWLVTRGTDLTVFYQTVFLFCNSAAGSNFLEFPFSKVGKLWRNPEIRWMRTNDGALRR
jgi:hypothetical protein